MGGLGRKFLHKLPDMEILRNPESPFILWIQIDIYFLASTSYEFKVTVTNNKINPRKVVLFHEERGSQEGIFSELKTHCQMDYIPVNTGVGNQLYMFAGILAHNLTRELQIRLNTSRPWHHGETRRAVVLPRD